MKEINITVFNSKKIEKVQIFQQMEAVTHPIENKEDKLGKVQEINNLNQDKIIH